MVLAEVIVGAFILFTMSMMFMMGFFLFFMDYFGVINVFFSLSPFKPSYILPFVNIFGDLLKMTQFVVINYFVALYSHNI